MVLKHRYTLSWTVLSILMFGLVSQIQAQHIPEAAAEDFHTAIRLYQEGLYENSIEYFNRYLQDNPDSQMDENARYHLALAYAKVNPEEAEIYIEEFARYYPAGFRTAELFKFWGNERFEERDFVTALDFYKRAFEINQSSKDAALLYYRKAETSVQLGDIESASEYYLNISERYPDSDLAPPALYARGNLYLRAEQYQAATDAFELLRSRHPNHAMTRKVGTALGESYYQQGRYQEAIESLLSAIQYVDGDSESKAILLIAESYNYLNELQRATTFYRRYINMNRGKDQARLAHYGLGWVYHKQQVYHWAAESFGNAVSGDDEISRKALYYKAVNEKLSGRYDLAMRSFQEFGDRYTEGIWVERAYYEWAVTAFEMGNNVKALEVLLQLIRSGQELENAGDIYTLLGEAYFANNEFTRAIQAFEAAEQVAEVDRDIQRQARFQRAWVQYQNQAYPQAQATFQELYEEDNRSTLSGEALFWSADSYYNMENFSRAINQFERFLSEFPDHEYTGAALYSLGWAYFKTQQYDKAVDPLTDFLNNYEPPPIALFPYDIDTKLRIADAYFAQGMYRDAINFYEEAIGAEPGGDYALFQIANSYHRDEQTFEAVSTFRRLIRIYPFSQLREQAQYNVGYIYFLSGNYSQAIDEFHSLINQFPNSTWAARSQYNIGDAYYNAGEYENAVAAYKRVLERYPRSAYVLESINGIQFSQLAAGMEDTSTEVMEEFLTNHPQSGTADRLRFQLAENQLQSGNFEEAISLFRNYLRVTNSERLLAEAHYNIGEAFERLNNKDAAIREYQRIVSEHSDSDRANEALYNLGRLYYEKGEYRLSVSAYESLVSHSPALRLEALVGAGNAYIAMGDADRAQERFMQGLRENANHEESQLGIGKVALAKNNYNEAERIFRQVASTSTAGPGAEAQYYLGMTYQQQSNYNEALRAYSNVRILFEGYEEWASKSLLRSAECHMAMGSRQEGENILNQLVERYPDSQAALQAMRQLNQNQ